jgi:hypothetical protein
VGSATRRDVEVVLWPGLTAKQARHAVRSARQSALGRRAGEGPDPGEQLALGDRTALLDLDPALAAVVGVVGPDVVRETLDDLAVPDQVQVVVDRQHAGDVIDKGSHVFVAMAFAARVLLGVFEPPASGSRTSPSPAIRQRGRSTILTSTVLSREYGILSPTCSSCHSGWMRVAECPSA